MRKIACRCTLLLWIPMMLASIACGSPETADPDWAIAIHGGAGVIDRGQYESLAPDYEEALGTALRAGTKILENGGSAVDAVTAVITTLEDDERFNAGRGAVFTHEGRNELDAAIMDGSTLACGAVTGVTTVRNPILLARRVMEQSRHIFFSGTGAERFADQHDDIARVTTDYFFTQARYDSLQRARASESREKDMDTVGAVALDRSGNLAAATSTGGLTNKRFGRIGDVPVIGAGTYADESVAVSCTGVGEQFIRNVIGHEVSSQVRLAGRSLQAAADETLHRLNAGDGGLISVSRRGEIALVFNTAGMFRGAADSNGRFEVAIWE
jgi:beta-aspartyl-peptidase (threonine type)